MWLVTVSVAGVGAPQAVITGLPYVLRDISKLQSGQIYRDRR